MLLQGQGGSQHLLLTSRFSWVYDVGLPVPQLLVAYLARPVPCVLGRRQASRVLRLPEILAPGAMVLLLGTRDEHEPDLPLDTHAPVLLAPSSQYSTHWPGSGVGEEVTT